jgi:AcrR family transcriptional regulator
MYHHFTGKADLARAAIRRSADELRATAETALCGEGTAVERISAYLRQEREVLRGCRIGGLAQDPDIIADPKLRQPVAEAFDWLHARLTAVLAEGKARGEFPAGLVPNDVAATIAAVVQGGYVLARATDSEAPFTRAIEGVRALLLSGQP